MYLDLFNYLGVEPNILFCGRKGATPFWLEKVSRFLEFYKINFFVTFIGLVLYGNFAFCFKQNSICHFYKSYFNKKSKIVLNA